jgi:pyruvate ferredoxin oxidoreductase alpha subunit
VIVGLGSVLGTVKDAVDELRESGERVGVLGITSFRPFPAAAAHRALPASARHLLVLERALAPGSGGIVTADIRASLAQAGSERTPRISTVIAGLGGRPVTRKSLRRLVRDAWTLPPLSFLDLDHGLVEAELARMRTRRRSGPSAENMLRDLGAAPSVIGH